MQNSTITGGFSFSLLELDLVKLKILLGVFAITQRHENS